MMELTLHLAQIREFLNQIIETPGKIIDLLRLDVHESMSRLLNQLIASEITFLLG